MQTPNIFLHYYNSDEAVVSFLEIMQSDVAPEILTVIQEELVHQLSGAGLAEKLPNFDWQNARMQEKWQSAVNLLLPHVILPNFIWQGWIDSLGQQSPVTQTEVPSFAELLSSEVYYASPIDSLPDIEEKDISVNQAETIPDYFEAKDELPEIILPIEQVEEPEITEAPIELEKSKSINEIHAESSEEKVIDTIQVTDPSLKNMVEINMTNSLWESISLFQKLNFIQDLFNGNADEFQRLIEFVDSDATATQWKSEIESRFGQYLHPENEDTWNEFYILVDRKFN
ncbi:hypothetical protein [Aquirufa sp.]|jgi:hypothetical protein|uniref:hypothetical protein n=1 Tax=Aquirufa sp. TaxID=2676249 RepID=UPI0037BEA193